ncbi:MAG: sugar phosphate isomerase/epimerase [Clostridiales bacterium]|nr:sugar phosphate isomerase/epimerase [Clostridiales bacterium]
MIIGMRGHDFGRMEPHALAAAISGCGYRAVQLAFGKAFAGKPESYLSDDALLSLRRTFSGHALAIPVMGCYVSAGDRNAAVRMQEAEKFARYLRASVKLGAQCVGTETTHFTAGESEREEAYAGLLEFTRHVAKAAEDCGAIAAVEPVSYHTMATPELTRRLLDDVSSAHLRVILDPANLLPPGVTSSSVQLDLVRRSLTLFGDKVCALHIKDGIWNSENRWENRPLGEGCMDWEAIFPLLRANNDSLCALREGVWPGREAEECRMMQRWAQR